MRIEILQGTAVLRSIPYNGTTYVEAPPTGDYKLRLTNDCPRTREAVVSVDGVNVISGKDAGFTGQGWLLRPWESLVIPGWLRSNQEAASFTFESKEGSYAAKVGKGTTNTGVIGVAVFEEKVKPQPSFLLPPVIIKEEHHHHHHPRPLQWPYPRPYDVWYGSSGTGVNGILRGGGNGSTFDVNCSTADSGRSTMGVDYSFSMDEISEMFSLSAVMPVAGCSAAAAAAPSEEGRTLGSGPSKGVLRAAKSARGGKGTVSLESATKSAPTTSPAPDLGTGYGSRVSMHTHTVDFERASETPSLVLSVRYGVTAKLREWGVPVDVPVSTEVATPNPFPAQPGFAASPPGWGG